MAATYPTYLSKIITIETEKNLFGVKQYDYNHIPVQNLGFQHFNTMEKAKNVYPCDMTFII